MPFLLTLFSDLQFLPLDRSLLISLPNLPNSFCDTLNLPELSGTFPTYSTDPHMFPSLKTPSLNCSLVTAPPPPSFLMILSSRTVNPHLPLYYCFYPLYIVLTFPPWIEPGTSRFEVNQTTCLVPVRLSPGLRGQSISVTYLERPGVALTAGMSAVVVHVLQTTQNWSFYVVALQRTAKKCTKSYNARAQLLFCSLNLLFSDVPVAVAFVVILNSLLFKQDTSVFYLNTH